MHSEKTACRRGTLFPACVAALVILASAVAPATRAEPDKRMQESEQAWEEKIRPQVFQDREIHEGAGQNVIGIKVPFQAEDSALVPISIHSRIPQTPELYIRRMHVFIDRNPVPLVGIFELSPLSGRADMAMRVRVDWFTYVRVIAELSNDELYMDKGFVRSAGGCSAPPGASLEESLARLGEMRIRPLGEWSADEPGLVQLKIRHPNVTGLAKDPRTSYTPPPYFVNRFAVDYGGNPVLSGNLTFAISQDPSFRFFLLPQEGAALNVTAGDTRNKQFSLTYDLGHDLGHDLGAREPGGEGEDLTRKR